MNRTKIDWADMSWNPVTGCLNGCPYCYARRMAQRFDARGHGAEIEATMNGDSKRHVVLSKNPFPFGFEPTLYIDRMEDPFLMKKPQTIFVCSMADLFGDWVPDAWITKVFEACKRAPWHRYMFLTKHPEGLWRDKPLLIDKNYWYGTTITRNEDLERIGWIPLQGCRFLSIEPMLEAVDLEKRPVKAAIPFADWVIIGAETGNRKGRVIPEKAWVMQIAEQCQAAGVPVFMKESLRGLMGKDFVQDKPWEVRA